MVPPHSGDSYFVTKLFGQWSFRSVGASNNGPRWTRATSLLTSNASRYDATFGAWLRAAMSLCDYRYVPALFLKRSSRNGVSHVLCGTVSSNYVRSIPLSSVMKGLSKSLEPARLRELREFEQSVVCGGTGPVPNSGFPTRWCGRGSHARWTSLTDPYGLGKASWKRLRRQLTDACTMTIMLPRPPRSY